MRKAPASCSVRPSRPWWCGFAAAACWHEERRRDRGQRPLAHGALVCARLRGERALRLRELILELHTLLARQRHARKTLLETGDRGAQLEDRVLLLVRDALQILDAHVLRRHVAELAEPQDCFLHLRHRDAQNEDRASAQPGRVHVDGRDVAAVAASDLHRAGRVSREVVTRNANAQPGLVLVEPRRARRERRCTCGPLRQRLGRRGVERRARPRKSAS